MDKSTRVPAVCGIVAPIFMVALWTLASILRPGYDQLTQRGSELGTGPYSIVMNINFAITGLLMMIFVLGLGKNVHGGCWSTIGVVFLGVSGIGEAAAAGFPCDPGCPLTGSLSQLVHTWIAVISFSSISIAPLLVSFGLDRDPFWKTYRNYTLVTGLLSVIGFAAFSWSVLVMFQYIGIVQRLFLAVPFQWIGIMAYHLFRST